MIDVARAASPSRQLGLRVRRLRLARGWSAERLAERASVGRSTISQIERGKCAPTINVVARLARALDIDLTTLVTGGDGRSRAVVLRGRRGWPPPIIGQPLAICPLFPPDEPRLARFYRVVVAGGARAAPGVLPASDHATLLVGEGEVVIEVGDQRHHLGPSDAIAVRTDRPYALVNPAAADAVLYAVFAGPAPPLLYETRDASQ